VVIIRNARKDIIGIERNPKNSIYFVVQEIPASQNVLDSGNIPLYNSTW